MKRSKKPGRSMRPGVLRLKSTHSVIGLIIQHKKSLAEACGLDGK
jgi:hypothetical protein